MPELGTTDNASPPNPDAEFLKGVVRRNTE